MSNIKLKDHNWAAEGIYDTNQSKSQQTINSDVNTKIGQATLQTSSQNLSGATNELKGRADTLDSKYDNVVTVANTQPSSEYNKVWLPLTVSEGTQVPTWAEHQELSGAINDVSTRGAGYTPSFTLDPNSPPTIDNVMFSYVKVSPNLLMVFGRFRLYAKNTTRTDLSLKFSLPSGFTSDTGRPNSFGVVFGPSAITDFVLALSSGSSTIELALGGSRSYSISTLTDGDNAYYSVIAFIPIN